MATNRTTIRGSVLATVTGGEDCGAIFDSAAAALRLAKDPPYGFSELGPSYARSWEALNLKGVQCKLRERGIKID